MDDRRFMQEAILEAEAAAERGEVPVGAVVVFEGEVIARAGNRREGDVDPLAHAEVLAIRQAASRLGRWRLTGCILYVTLEPCSMCAGAAVLARIDRLVYGAADHKAGAAGSLYDIVRDDRLNHRLDVRAGVLAEDCAGLLRSFFEKRRSKARVERSEMG